MSTRSKARQKRGGKAAGPGMTQDAEAPSIGLAGAVMEVIDLLRGRPGAAEASDGWELIVRIIADNGSLPMDEVEVIERAIAEAYRGWSDAQRRSVWCETESGMTGDRDDEVCDTSFNGIGYALQVEMLDEVTQAAWRDARELGKAAAKRAGPRRGGRH